MSSELGLVNLNRGIQQNLVTQRRVQTRLLNGKRGGSIWSRVPVYGAVRPGTISETGFATVLLWSVVYVHPSHTNAVLMNLYGYLALFIHD